MSDLVIIVTKILAVSTVLCQVFIVVALFALSSKNKRVLAFFKGKEMIFGFIVAMAGMLISLFYSNFANFPACDLCWYQRIFFYPIAFILGIAIYKKDQKIADYILFLSLFGSLIAIYHNYLQLGGSPLIPCDADGLACGKRYIWEFGYIGIPMMSLTGFWTITSLMKIQKFNYSSKVS